MYIHCGCALFWFVQSLWILSITCLPHTTTTLPPPRFSTSLYPLPSYLMVCNITDALSLYFPFHDYHTVVPLLQTCSTSEFVYDHACFVYVYLWIYLPHTRENMHLLCFWSRLTSLSVMFSTCIHLSSNPVSLFLVAE
jgi:hypothetical protein